MFRLQLGIRFKILIYFLALTLVVCASLIYVAVDYFERDKISYLFDSSLSSTRLKARQIRQSIDSELQNIRNLLIHFDPKAKDFTKKGRQIFARNRNILKIQAGSLTNFQENKMITLVNTQAIKPPGQSSLDIQSSQNFDTLGFQVTRAKEGIVTLFFPSNLKGEIIACEVYIRSLEELLSEASPWKTSLLFDQSRRLSFSSQKNDEGLFAETAQWIENLTTPEGTRFIGQMDSHLVSASSIGFNFYAAELIPKNQALTAIFEYRQMAIWLGIFLFSLAAIAGLIFSKSISKNISSLVTATDQISNGNFDIDISISSNDEIKNLGDRFNQMAKEVSRLLSESVQKARMETELKTAQLVQQTLVPQTGYKDDHIEIYGLYEPANECGGDWWHFHHDARGRLFLWLGDATGHGAGPALITSAARATAGILEHGQYDAGPGTRCTQRCHLQNCSWRNRDDFLFMLLRSRNQKTLLHKCLSYFSHLLKECKTRRGQ